MKSAYERFLELKQIKLEECGIDVPIGALNPKLFDFQRDIVRWALRKGRAALFCDCGLGKTPMQLEWANKVPGRVLILAPLAVAQQTIREANKFGIVAAYARETCSAKITVTNYEMLSHFSAADYQGIVLDESSILKSFDGVFRNLIIDTFSKTPYRLACTATPAPNDYMELGNHSEFLGALSRTEMFTTAETLRNGD
jgi:superfamily II DNA or RNA helicase